MGLLDSLKLLRSMTEAAVESSPRWAKILKITAKRGPMYGLTLEVHYGNEEPVVESVMAWPPRGVEPQVGRDVFVRPTSSDSHSSWAIEWDRPPQYGSPRE